MYRCYLIHQGRITKAEELASATLAEAVAEGQALLQTDAGTRPDSGIEIWHHASCLYSDCCHAGDTGSAASIDSPFATAEPTMRPTRWPSQARPLLRVA